MCRGCFRHFQKHLELETKLTSNIQVAVSAGTDECSGMSEPAVNVPLAPSQYQ